jgi:hypothetical protein
VVCIHLHSFARRPGWVATAVIGFRKATRHTQAQMAALGQRWVLGVLVWQADAAIQRQPGSRAWGEDWVQRGMVSGAGQRAGYRD